MMLRQSSSLTPYIFIHINKTGGTSICASLGISKVHQTAATTKKMISEETWNNAFKFAFVRNPWDKVVSQFHYRASLNITDLQSNPVEFANWVKLAYSDRDPRLCYRPEFFLPQYDWLVSENGRIELDFIGRFEHLATDFQVVAATLGVAAKLPHLNASDHNHYRDYYTDETAEIIQRAFDKDIKLFGYKY